MSTNSHFTNMVHVLTLLACTGQPTSSTMIAGSVNTNPVVIRQIVGQLRDAGLVETLPGKAGGAVLGREAAEITLGEIYSLVKDDTLFGLHPNEPNPRCLVGRNIQEVLAELFCQMDSLIADALSSISVADVVNRISCSEQEKNLPHMPDNSPKPPRTYP